MKREGPFIINEWLEALLRCRDEQPRRFAREVSLGLQTKVRLYAERKARATLKKAA
jgi:hypothetical protein